MIRLPTKLMRHILPTPNRTLASWSSGASEFAKQLRNLLQGTNGANKQMDDNKAQQRRKKKKVVDAEPVTGTSKDALARLPSWLDDWRTEFPKETPMDRRYQRFEATRRIVRIAAGRVLDPAAIALFGMSVTVVLGIGTVEASLWCTELPFFSLDSTSFAVRYALEQLLPSCKGESQDASLIATAMGFDPQVFLLSLDPSNPADATRMLNIKLLETSRSIAAGIGILAQIVRAGTIGAAAPQTYEERVRLGKEPPILPRDGGVIVRLVGLESDATLTSLRRMGHHIFPVFEDPRLVAPMVSQHSDGYRLPVYWCVRPEKYGLSYSWKGFPVSNDFFIQTKAGTNVLILEADATNSNDPLSLVDAALDLTIEDASQGFSRIKELFETSSNTDINEFHTLRVLLGNTLWVSKSGGGHSFTLRHRVKYAKEVDVLIDSRAPVLKEILAWCKRVAGKDRKILFQTSDRQYFLSLQLLMRRYGYDLFDPLDWRREEFNVEEKENMSEEDIELTQKTRTLLSVVMDDDDQLEPFESGEPANEDNMANQDALRRLTKLSRLPRLVYYDKTPETVNAVQALINAGEVEATNCCALLDKREGTLTLKRILGKQPELVQDDKMSWVQRPSSSSSDESKEDTSGLHIICSSTIYDDLFRQVRQWTRMGYKARQIQRELDIRFQPIIKQSQEVHEDVVDLTLEEAGEEQVQVEMKTPRPPSDVVHADEDGFEEEEIEKK